MPAGAMKTGVVARVRNTTGTIWEREGPSRVQLRLLIVDSNGNPWPEVPEGAGFSYPVPPGGLGTTRPFRFEAPGIPGRYTVLCGIVRPLPGKKPPEEMVSREVYRHALHVTQKEKPGR